MDEVLTLYEKRKRETMKRIDKIMKDSDGKLEESFSMFTMPMLKEQGKVNARLVQTSITFGLVFGKWAMDDVREFDEFKNIWDDSILEKYKLSYDNSVNTVIREYAFELSKFRDEQSAREVQQIVSDGVRDGLSIAEIRSQLLEKVDNIFGEHHADTVARTESARGFALGNLISYLDDKDIRYMEYSAVLDTRTTDICRSRDGLVFDKNDTQVRYMIPAHYRCRSIWVPVVDEEPDEVERPNIPEQGFLPNAYSLFDILFNAILAGVTFLQLNEEEEQEKDGE